MTKTSVSLAALMLIAACSATAASPNVPETPTAPPAATATVETAAPAPVAAPAAPTRSMRASQRADAGPSAQHAAPMTERVSCDLRARPTTNGVVIEAVARADHAFDGQYELVIAKSGGGGAADVNQSGPVSVAAGEAVTLGSTELGADGHFRAQLTLSDASGVVCRQERRS